MKLSQTANLKASKLDITAFRWAASRGEAADVNPAVVDVWKKGHETILEGYAPEDIYNADETGVFLRATRKSFHSLSTNRVVLIRLNILAYNFRCGQGVTTVEENANISIGYNEVFGPSRMVRL